MMASTATKIAPHSPLFCYFCVIKHSYVIPKMDDLG